MADDEGSGRRDVLLFFRGSTLLRTVGTFSLWHITLTVQF